MREKIKKKLDEFHRYNAKAREHFSAYELIPGQPLHVHTEKDLMMSSKWRIKANIALNEFHSLLVEEKPNNLPWKISDLKKEKELLEKKLSDTEEWLESHSS